MPEFDNGLTQPNFLFSNFFDKQNTTYDFNDQNKSAFGYLPFLRPDHLLSISVEEFLPKSLELYNNFNKENSHIYNSDKTQSDYTFSLFPETDFCYFKKDNFCIDHPSFRFRYSIFSWDNFKSLKESIPKYELIPFDLLDAITKSNYELFFLQKAKYPNSHRMYIDTLHSFSGEISKASPLKATDLITYLSITGLIIAFVIRYLNYTHE